jgi:hypothetical protein
MDFIRKVIPILLLSLQLLAQADKTETIKGYKLNNNAIQIHLAPNILYNCAGISYERSIPISKWKSVCIKIGGQGQMVFGIITDDLYGWSGFFKTGFKLGSGRNYFDIFIGGAYFYMDNEPFSLFAPEIAYRLQLNNSFVFRVGAGLPEGIFLSFGAAF